MKKDKPAPAPLTVENGNYTGAMVIHPVTLQLVRETELDNMATFGVEDLCEAPAEPPAPADSEA